MKSKYLSFTLATLLLLNQSAQAGVASSLKSAFNNLNFNSNVNGPSAFDDQSGGYYTLGSVYARSPVKNMYPINIQSPNFKGSCNGIDMFLGALSFIKGGEILRNLKTAIPAAAGYGFSIAMQNALPMVYNSLSEMQDWIQKINAMNINSCKLGALVNAGIWSQSDASSDTLCNALTLGTQIDYVDDYASSKHKCSNQGTRKSIIKGKSGEFQDILGDEYNLTWKAIRKNTFLSSNNKTAEYFMSIAGTLLKKEGDRYASHKPSLAFDQNLIEMLLFGVDENHKKKGTAKVYTCPDTDQCLTMKKREFRLIKENAIASRVEAVLESLIDKLRDNVPPTLEEKGLVNATAIPVMEMIIVEAAHRRGKAPISILNYKDEIAYDILIGELNTILDVVHHNLGELEKVQIDGETIHRFKQEIKDVRSRLFKQRQGILAHIDRALAAIQQTEQLKQKLHWKFNQYIHTTKG